MRQIKFRGKRLDNGEWVYGDLIHRVGTHSASFIAEGDGYYTERGYINDETDVYPNSVGQFTGMLDKNGKEIYEGDILSDGEVKYEVWYSEDRAGFIAEMRDPQNDLVDYLGGYDSERMMTVIGSIHDNPELLKGG